MKKVKILMISLFVTSFAMAQESDAPNDNENNATMETIIEAEVIQNINTSSEVLNVELEKKSMQIEFIAAPEVAVSNSSNLKMLHVASTLFYTRNFALT